MTGAGSGIGRAAALRFAAEGARVVVADIDAERATAVMHEIETGGGSAVAVTGDLTEQSVVDRVVSTAVDSFGGLDVLVNNAGIMDRMSATADVSDADWERVLRVNLTAPFLLTRAALPHMLARGKGAIVNTASEAALRGSAAGTVTARGRSRTSERERSSKTGRLPQPLHPAEQGSPELGLDGYTPPRRSPDAVACWRPLLLDFPRPATTVTYTVSKHGIVGLTKSVAVMRRDTTPASAPTPSRLAARDRVPGFRAASNINGVILPVDNGWSAV